MNRILLLVIGAFAALSIAGCGDAVGSASGELPQEENTDTISEELAGCGSACTQCVLEKRPDILPFYQQNGWDISCGNHDNIASNWCGIDPNGCKSVKTGVCAASCGASSGCNVNSYPTGQWNACLYTGTNMNTYVASETWSSVNYDWGNAGPHGLTDRFSVEARSTVCFAPGTYVFRTVSDDGVQLYVNNSPVITNWTDHGPTENASAAVALNGCVPLRARYYENGGGAVFKVSWARVEGCGSKCTQCVLQNRTDILPFYQRNGWDVSCGNQDNIVSDWCRIDPNGCNAVKSGPCAASCTVTGCNTNSYPTGQWNACLYTGTSMNTFVASETWNSINYDWGNGGPRGLTDRFSVEARSTVCLAPGTYVFRTVSDDGIQLYVNNSLVIDNWTDHGTTENASAPVVISNSNSCVPLRARYYENGGGAVFKVSWQATNGCGSACTQCVLRNRTDILPFYQRNGWDVSCGNYDNIVSNWCGIDPDGCNALDTGVCTESCGTGPKKVLVLVYNPILRTQGNQRLTAFKGWNDANELARQLKSALFEASHGHANYQIVETIERDEFPMKQDGYVFTEEAYLAGQWHYPGNDVLVDYNRIIDTVGIAAKVNSGAIDEVWMYGAPWMGFWEAAMAGPGAFFINGGPIQNVSTSRKFAIMGLSYERGTGEGLESFSHRAEYTLMHAYGSWQSSATAQHDWDRFTLYAETAARAPDQQTACGNVHYAPNATSAGDDYDWGKAGSVKSACDEWLHFPNVNSSVRDMSAADWGSNAESHHKWWLRHFPHAVGEKLYEAKKKRMQNNWWKYVVEYNRYE